MDDDFNFFERSGRCFRGIMLKRYNPIDCGKDQRVCFEKVCWSEYTNLEQAGLELKGEEMPIHSYFKVLQKRKLSYWVSLVQIQTVTLPKRTYFNLNAF